MLSPRQESHMITKSSSSSSNGRRDWSQVLPSPPLSAASGSSNGTIRVIHIFAPKIIKTDVANFRQLVQRLTGNTKRSSSGIKSKRGARSRTSSSSPRDQQILSQYRNATQIFTSPNRVEYIIPRPSEPYFSPPPRLSFSKQEQLEDVKPLVRLPVREPSRSFVDCSRSISDQSCCSPYSPVEVTSPPHPTYYRGGQQLKDPSSLGVNCSSGMTGSNVRTCSQQQQQQQQQQGSVTNPKPIVEDPFQSLSGYKEKLAPTSHKLPMTPFPLVDDRDHCHTFSNRFSEMEILTGLVKPGPVELSDFSAASPHASTNSSSDFTFQSNLLNNSNSFCRFSVQSPLREDELQDMGPGTSVQGFSSSYRLRTSRKTTGCSGNVKQIQSPACFQF